MLRRVIAALVVCLGVASAADPVPCLAQLDLPTLTLPTDGSFAELKQEFNDRFDVNTPLAIASVGGEEDIIGVLACARDANVPAVARNGRHSYEGYSTLSGSVVIDLRPDMTQVTVLPDKEMLTAQSGATLGQVYAAAWGDAGKGFSGGTHPTVGISGLTLGGGYGFLSRREGLACDQIVSLSMVAWNGSVFVANATQNQDLLWASCGGGGGNFGIVTDWTFRLAVVPDAIEYAELEVPDDATAAMWSFFQSWAPTTADPNLGMSFKPSRNPGTIEMYYFPPAGAPAAAPADGGNATSGGAAGAAGGSSAAGKGAAAGSAADLATLIQSSGLLEVSPGLDMPDIKELTWPQVVAQYSGNDGMSLDKLAEIEFGNDRVTRREKSFYLYQPLSPDGVNKLTQLLDESGGPFTFSLQFHPYGGKVAVKANNATAFPHRQGVLGLIQAIASWDNPGDEEGAAAAEAWLQELQSIVTAEQPHRGYVNYLDENPAQDWRKVYYVDNYAKLLQVKASYDPTHGFDFPQAIGHADGVPAPDSGVNAIAQPRPAPMPGPMVLPRPPVASVSAPPPTAPSHVPAPSSPEGSLPAQATAQSSALALRCAGAALASGLSFLAAA